MTCLNENALNPKKEIVVSFSLFSRLFCGLSVPNKKSKSKMRNFDEEIPEINAILVFLLQIFSLKHVSTIDLCVIKEEDIDGDPAENG